MANQKGQPKEFPKHSAPVDLPNFATLHALSKILQVNKKNLKRELEHKKVPEYYIGRSRRYKLREVELALRNAAQSSVDGSLKIEYRDQPKHLSGHGK